MVIRPARSSDVPQIYALIEECAAQGFLLPRTREGIRSHIADYLVSMAGWKLAGCVALESYTANLAEVRSLAVHGKFRGVGHGSRLLLSALDAAQTRGIARVFAVTHSPALFLRAGFFQSSRMEIPEKLERDCSVCPKMLSCRLQTLITVALPRPAQNCCQSFLSVIPFMPRYEKAR